MTRAAARLNLAQPALSQAIATLEAQLGVGLFERHARGVKLTPVGEAFLAKTRIALAAADDADVTANSLSREASDELAIGFIGAWPMVKESSLFAAFTNQHPHVRVRFEELPFPRGATGSWLRDVDVAFCQAPDEDPAVRAEVVRVEPRVVIAPVSHPLARQGELTVADALDETFIGYHRNVQREWAGFHSLDDHRGGPPSSATEDRALTVPEMLISLTMRRGITIFPASDAAVTVKVLRGVVALPLCDAQPARLMLSWRRDNPNPNIAALVHLAAHSADDGRSAGDGVSKAPASADAHGSASEIAAPRKLAAGSGTKRSGAA